MRFDVFCSIAQTPIANRIPAESTLLVNFLEQARAADELGYGTLWVAESHYSSELQKRHLAPVIPHWKGEIGLNTDICQLAHRVFGCTRRIEVGSAIMNIVCNGGPLPAAERVATALAWHGLDPDERRKLHIGFAVGRFDFINRLTGIAPREQWEELAWPQVRNAILREAAEIFVRLLQGEELRSDDIQEQALTLKSFNDPAKWAETKAKAGAHGETLRIPRRWNFEITKVIPCGWRRELLRLVVGSHDPDLQVLLNTFAPVRVFNLSITSPDVIETTHERMRHAYHPAGGPWQRSYMPRTVFVFLNAQAGLTPERQRTAAQEEAESALAQYWIAMEGTLEPGRVARAADNALIGNPEDIARQIVDRFDPHDRLMLWFDFFNHDSARVVANMEQFMHSVVPRLADLGIPTRRHPSE